MTNRKGNSVPLFPRYRSRSPACLITVAVTLCCLLMAGCATPRFFQADSNLLAKSGYNFIQDGVSSRDELQARLGVPVYEFEQKRILIYRCQKLGEGFVVLSDTQPEVESPFRKRAKGRPDLGSMVLVFDANGILQKHSLVMSQ